MTSSRTPAGSAARRLAVGGAAVALFAAAVVLGTTIPTRGHRPTGQPSEPPVALVAYHDCAAMLQDLRAHAAASYNRAHTPVDAVMNAAPVPAERDASAAGSVAAPDHSTTNVQEHGVGEPDTVETDGRRIVTITGGVLRVVDTAAHRVTGQLDLNEYAGAQDAEMLMSGNRLLVLLRTAVRYPGGPIPLPAQSGAGAPDIPAPGGTTALLVDFSGATPKIVDTLHANGGYLDARLVGHTARLVVQSVPSIPGPDREAIQNAPITAWLPSYQTDAGQRTAPCDAVSHPANFTGDSLLTIYTLDLAGSLRSPRPVTVAGGGSTVYATASDLYVASSDGRDTQLHRFAITGTSRPRYLGSGSVPGWLLNSYSLSAYAGVLRIVTTTGAATAVYTLNAATLRIRGHVGGLGSGEQLRAVRFIGPLGYVVTFRSVDPLYVLDLRDPTRPRKAGELTITGYSDYLHPVGSERLLGVGQDVTDNRVTGAQVSLFDVTDPANPKRLARVVRTNTPSETPLDPHAFLYWPTTGTAVVPITSWNTNQSGAALVLTVGRNALRVAGTLRNPAGSGGIQRTLVVGKQLWTLSETGLQASDLHTLHTDAWVPFG